MPRLAIVIAAVDNAELLEGTLVSVLENRPADCEVLVALGAPYADPYDLKDEVRFVQAARGASSVAAVGTALAAVRSPFVHLLASGCEVTEGWAESALARFGDRQIGSVAPVVFDAKRRDRVMAAGVGYRKGGRRFLVARGREQLDGLALTSALGPCGFAAFYRKAALDFVGGLSTQLSRRHADVDLALILRRAGFAAAVEPASRVFATPEVDRGEGAFREALSSERLFWRNLERSPLGEVLTHGACVTLEMLASLGRPRMVTQLAARLLACCQLGRLVRHQKALDQLSRRAVGSKPLPEHYRIDRSHKRPAHSDNVRAQLPSR